MMSTSDLVAAIVGALMPALIAVIVRSTWPGWLKGVAAVGSSVVVGTVTAWIAGALATPEGWAQKVLIVVAAAQVAYRAWWQPTGIGPAIERATQPGQPQAPTMEAGGTGFQAELAVPSDPTTTRRR